MSPIIGRSSGTRLSAVTLLGGLAASIEPIEGSSLLSVLLGVAAALVVALGGAWLFILGRGRHGGAHLAQARAEAAEQRCGEIIGIVGHDLRTPLHAIRMAAWMLLRHGVLAPRDEKIVARISTSADRMTRLISELHDFTVTQVPTGLTISKRRVDLGQVCSEIVEELEVAYPGRAICLEAGPDAFGEWDPDRLGQVVANLVGNAILYSAPESPVQVRLGGDAGRVELSVHNDGAEIPDELLPHLFEPFRRGQRSSNAHERGLGLGLYISRQIVLAHGGEIHVRSTREGGTTFTIRLPRAGDLDLRLAPADPAPRGGADLWS